MNMVTYALAMFNDDDLQRGIIEIFSEAQEPYAEAASVDAIVNGDVGPLDGNGRPRLKSASGYRIFSTIRSRALTPEDRALGVRFVTPRQAQAKRDATAAAKERDIRERLLAGERPKIGGRGRPPTRWFAIAKELGIELGAS